MPVGITVDDVGSVWFIDRGADMLGYLDLSSDTFYLFDVPVGSSPIGLALGEAGTDIWFVAENSDYIGRLAVPAGPRIP
jgi:streptogramin lyase